MGAAGGMVCGNDENKQHKHLASFIEMAGPFKRFLFRKKFIRTPTGGRTFSNGGPTCLLLPSWTHDVGLETAFANSTFRAPSQSTFAISAPRQRRRACHPPSRNSQRELSGGQFGVAGARKKFRSGLVSCAEALGKSEGSPGRGRLCSVENHNGSAAAVKSIFSEHARYKKISGGAPHGFAVFN